MLLLNTKTDIDSIICSQRQYAHLKTIKTNIFLHVYYKCKHSHNNKNKVAINCNKYRRESHRNFGGDFPLFQCFARLINSIYF